MQTLRPFENKYTNIHRWEKNKRSQRKKYCESTYDLGKPEDVGFKVRQIYPFKVTPIK